MGIDGAVSGAGGLALGVDRMVRANPPLQERMSGGLPRAGGWDRSMGREEGERCKRQDQQAEG